MFSKTACAQLRAVRRAFWRARGWRSRSSPIFCARGFCGGALVSKSLVGLAAARADTIFGRPVDMKCIDVRRPIMLGLKSHLTVKEALAWASA